MLLLLEFQSEKDARMPLRNLECTAFLYGVSGSRCLVLSHTVPRLVAARAMTRSRCEPVGTARCRILARVERASQGIEAAAPKIWGHSNGKRLVGPMGDPAHGIADVFSLVRRFGGVLDPAR